MPPKYQPGVLPGIWSGDLWLKMSTRDGKDHLYEFVHQVGQENPHYQVRMTLNGVQTHLGSFSRELAAAEAVARYLRDGTEIVGDVKPRTKRTRCVVCSTQRAPCSHQTVCSRAAGTDRRGVDQ